MLFQENQSNDVSENEAQEVKDIPAVFNKRLFAAQGSVTITPKAKCIMEKNADSLHDLETEYRLTKSELQAMRCVVDGLKLIHKGHDYVKDVLCHVITMETYGPHQYVVKKPLEENLSCYYIVCGAVEVRYDVRGDHSRNVYQSDIVYNHGTGEYLGIVSLEGRDEDIAPPSTVNTKEMTQFLRIDRMKFHKMAETISGKIKANFMDFLSDQRSIFKFIPEEAKEKIQPKLEVQEYRPNRVILTQGQRSNYLYFVISGRCRCNRRVYIPEAGKEVLFYLCCKEEGEFFGEECVLDNDFVHDTVTATTYVVCYRLHRSAFEIVKGGLLTDIVKQHRDEVLTEEDLQTRGYKNSIWNYYKHTKVKEPLTEKGHLKYLTRNKTPRLADRPLSAVEQYRENMLRFKEKGFCYEPVRPRTAIYRRPKSTASVRARSARARTTSPRMYNVVDDVYDSDQESQVTEVGEPKETQNRALSNELEKVLQEHGDDLEDEHIAKLLEENEELSRHLQGSLEGSKTTSMDKESFMKNSVLATMKSEDIVRKAMAMADKKAENMKRNKKAEEEEWSTVLHAENRQAKFLISVNKMKVAELKKQLDDLENKRMKITMKQQKQKAQKKNIVQNHQQSLPDTNDNDIEHSLPNNPGNKKGFIDTGSGYIELSTTSDLSKMPICENQNQIGTNVGKETHDDLKLKVIEEEEWDESVIQRLDTRLRPIDDISMQTTNGNIRPDQLRSISARF